MNAVCEKFGHHASYQYALCGAEAIDKVGDPFPEETFKVCWWPMPCCFLPWETLSSTMTLRAKVRPDKDFWPCARS